MEPVYKNLGKVRPTIDNNNWSIDNKYDLLTIVYDHSSNKSYISRKDVPANVVIDNREYWLPFGVGKFVDNAIININYLDGVSQELVTYTLEEAIARIGNEDKRLGVIISFYGNEASDSHTPGWCLYQFMSDDLNDWDNVDAWNSIYYNRNKNVGWFRTESELLAIYPSPHKGDYCYIGVSLISSLVYRCYENGTWVNTHELASANIGITIGGNIHISENGTWVVDDEDTGIKAAGTGVERMTYTPSQEDGGTNILQVKLTDGTQFSFPIKNGNQGNSGIVVPDLETFLAELVNNLTTDDGTKALSAAQGVVLNNKVNQLGRTMTSINPKDFVIGSIYEGSLDTSVLDTISTNSFYDVRGVNRIVVYSSGRNNRINFYDANKNYLSFTGAYTNDTSFVVPVGAAFCKLSFLESGAVWDLNNIYIGEFRSNVLINDVTAFLRDVNSVLTKTHVNNINIKYFVIGSYYQNYLDVSAVKAISTRDRFYFVHHLSKVYFRANLNDAPYQTRVSFYNSAHEFLSQEGYKDTDSFNVPNNAFYCKFSFAFERDTAINLNELIQGNFVTNAIEEDYQSKYNNGSKLLLPISKGYINFDNIAKKIIINGEIGILYNHSMQYIASGVEIQYPNNLTPGSGTYFFLVYDGVQFSIRLANRNYDNIIALEKVVIVACIWIDSDKTIRKDNISFCVVPFKINDDKIYDLDKLKEFSTHLISNNPVDTFLFFTDPHLENDAFIDFAKNDVMKNIENYYKRASLAKCICGGDWMNQFNDDSLGAAAMGNVYGFCYSTFHNFLPIQGNHDFNTYTDKPPLSNQTTVNIMMQKYGNNYYYEDNVVSRYYIFDSGYNTYATVATAYQYEQIDWVANLLLNGTKQHNIFFIHQAIIGGDTPDYVYSGFITQLTILADAYNNKQVVTINGITYDFSNTEGTVHCVIAGHKHQDVNTVLNNIPVVLTIDAQRGFDLCAIDYNVKKLYMTRIGKGQSREIDLA